MSKPIDVEAELELAFAELDSKIPDGYFETFSSKVAASLEAEASMQSTTPNPTTPNTPSAPPPSAERDEHSGLHEIKALAQTARNRISRRRTSESDVEEAILSSSSAALSAVVLPDPSSEMMPATPEPMALAPSASAPTHMTAMQAPSAGVPTWLWALGGTALVAAAAAAALFLFSRGGSSDGAAGEPAIAAADKADPPPAPPELTPAPQPTVAALDEAEPEPEEAAAAPGEAATDADTDTATEADSADAPATRGALGGAVSRRSEKARAKRAKDVPKRTETKKKPAEETRKAKAEVVTSKGGEGKADINQLLDEVAGSDPGKPKKEKAEEKKVDKKRLDSGDIRKAMGRVSGAVNKCQKKTGYIGRVSVKFSVSPSGKIGRVKASGGSGAAKSCVASAVKRARFPTFNPPSMSFRYSFLLSD